MDGLGHAARESIEGVFHLGREIADVGIDVERTRAHFFGERAWLCGESGCLGDAGIVERVFENAGSVGDSLGEHEGGIR